MEGIQGGFKEEWLERSFSTEKDSRLKPKKKNQIRHKEGPKFYLQGDNASFLPVSPKKEKATEEARDESKSKEGK